MRVVGDTPHAKQGVSVVCNTTIFGSSPNRVSKHSVSSSVWPEFLVWNQGVAGSNPALQTF